MLFFWVFILFQVHLTHNLVQAKTSTTLFPNAKSVNLVEIWSKDDFHCHVKRSDRPVIVVFYSHWCGHCKKYSPQFEKMVGQVFQEQKSWQNMITLAVVNCGASSVKIDRICSNLAISRVPTSMWFNGNHDKGSLPVKVPRNINQLESIIVSIVRDTKKIWESAWKYNMTKPVPVLDENELLAAEVQNHDSAIKIVTIRHPDPKVFRNAVMDMSSYHGIHLKYEKLLHPEVQSISYQHVTQTYLTRNDLRQELSSISNINQVLKPLNYCPKVSKTCRIGDQNCLPPSNDHARVLSNLIHSSIPAVLQSNKQFQKDIAADFLKLVSFRTIDRSTTNRKILGLTGAELDVLRIIVDYIDDNNDFELEKYQVLADQFPRPDHNWSEHCKGSESKYRGFTCGLWRLFHTLTITSDQVYVAPVITNFILQFFECHSCVANFRNNFNLEGYQNSVVQTHPDFPVQVGTPQLPAWPVMVAPYENAIWLWKWHNVVNKELEGGVNEDPEFKKYQFPAPRDCENCFDENGEYVEVQVGKFLSSYYK